MMTNDRNDSGSGDPQQRSGGRRRSRRGRGGGGGNRSQGPPQGGKGGGAPQGGKGSSGGQKGGGKGSQGGRRNRKRRKPSHGGTGFWGDPAKLPTSPADIRITDEPAAVPRSLGPPPLPGHEQIAVHYFTAVYDRSVSTAGALAAAGGLIDPESLVDEDD